MTLNELKIVLANRRIHPDAVCIGAGIPFEMEKYCILKEGEVWEVYYSERGKKRDLKQFVEEDDACQYLIDLLDQDESVWLS